MEKARSKRGETDATTATNRVLPFAPDVATVTLPRVPAPKAEPPRFPRGSLNSYMGRRVRFKGRLYDVDERGTVMRVR